MVLSDDMVHFLKIENIFNKSTKTIIVALTYTLGEVSLRVQPASNISKHNRCPRGCQSHSAKTAKLTKSQ